MRQVHLFEDLIGYRLRRADVLMMARLSEALAPLGLTPARVTALAFIHHAAGCDQAALGRALGINRASTMGLVDHLTASGLVERQPGADRRSHALHLTPAGETARRAMLGVLHEVEAAVFGMLDAAERADLGRLLNKVRHGLATSPAGPAGPIAFTTTTTH